VRCHLVDVLLLLDCVLYEMRMLLMLFANTGVVDQTTLLVVSCLLVRSITTTNDNDNDNDDV
jgi:hypothetical protein